MFAKLMSISDDLMWRYYALLTDLSPAQIEAEQAAATADGLEDGARPPHRRRLPRREAAAAAEEEWRRVHQERQAPSELRTVVRVAAGALQTARAPRRGRAREVERRGRATAAAERRSPRRGCRSRRASISSSRRPRSSCCRSALLGTCGSRPMQVVRNPHCWGSRMGATQGLGLSPKARKS